MNKSFHCIIEKLKCTHTGLFVSGMHPDKAEQEKELKNAYSEVLQKNASAISFLGGAYLFEKMIFFERMIIKKIAKKTTSVHRIDYEAIDVFVGKLKT